MKTINIAIDLRSFLAGALSLGVLLTFLNFTSDQDGYANQVTQDNRRFQVVTSERQTIILDTKTGRFILDPFAIPKPKWVVGDFEEIQKKDGK